jgi:hypothetical protein
VEFDWYLIFNLNDIPEEVISRTFSVSLEGIGSVDIEFNRGILNSLLYEGVLLPILFENQNPFIGLGNQYAVYQDQDQNIHFGVAVAA